MCQLILWRGGNLDGDAEDAQGPDLKEERCRRTRDEKLSSGIKIDSGSCVWLQSHAFKLGQNCSCVREESSSVRSFSVNTTKLLHICILYALIFMDSVFKYLE